MSPFTESLASDVKSDRRYTNLLTSGNSEPSMTAENWSQKLGHFVTSPPKDGSSSLGKLEPRFDEELVERQSTSRSSAGVVDNSLNSRLAAVLCLLT